MRFIARNYYLKYPSPLNRGKMLFHDSQYSASFLNSGYGHWAGAGTGRCEIEGRFHFDPELGIRIRPSVLNYVRDSDDDWEILLAFSSILGSHLWGFKNIETIANSD